MSRWRGCGSPGSGVSMDHITGRMKALWLEQRERFCPQPGRAGKLMSKAKERPVVRDCLAAARWGCGALQGAFLRRRARLDTQAPGWGGDLCSLLEGVPLDGEKVATQCIPSLSLWTQP